MTTSALFILHDVGDAGGGAPWADAFRAAGWTGSVVAPDLPGHAGTSPPEGGNHEPADAAFVAVRALEDERTAVVVGVGVNGWNAQLHGLAGRASMVVLVDGLGGPWTPVRDAVLRERDRLRAIADDPAAVALPPDGSMLDPRLRHGLAAHGSRS
ncbi:MAG: hypothetical protein M3Q68_03430, partial [Actinomycetota bacterium]|nr:hypothetical protein [Actinomycetota bacterium]